MDDLAGRGRIPDMLAEVAHELRRLGNLGAHDEDVDVAPADVPVIEDLADAILEYLYRAPAKLAAVRQGIEERKRGELAAVLRLACPYEFDLVLTKSVRLGPL